MQGKGVDPSGRLKGGEGSKILGVEPRGRPGSKQGNPGNLKREGSRSGGWGGDPQTPKRVSQGENRRAMALPGKAPGEHPRYGEGIGKRRAGGAVG